MCEISVSNSLAILRRYGYPPDKQEKATRTMLEQAEVVVPGLGGGVRGEHGLEATMA